MAGALPWIGDDVHAVDELALAASLTARAGQTLTGAAQRVGWNGNGIPGVSSDSGISAEVLTQIAPEVRAADADLTNALNVLDGVSTDGLLPPVQDAVVTARGELAARAELLGSATDVAELVPSLLAKGQRYLLIIQNPGEVRGTGGFMGFFGTLESDGTGLQLTKLFPTGDTPKVKAVNAPADFKARYARFQSLIDIRQANFTPDLPTAAGVITQMASELGWGRFDGIFLVDTVWMQYMLEATGPITAPGWDGADHHRQRRGRPRHAAAVAPVRAVQRDPGEHRQRGLGRDPERRSLAVGLRHRALAQREGAAHAALVRRPGAGGARRRARRDRTRGAREEPDLGGVAGPGREQGGDLHRAHDRRGRHHRRAGHRHRHHHAARDQLGAHHAARRPPSTCSATATTSRSGPSPGTRACTCRRRSRARPRSRRARPRSPAWSTSSATPWRSGS